MVKRSVIVSASLGIVLAACGNQSSNATTTPTPTATPYVATESGFSAAFPATPAKQTQKLNQPGNNPDLTLTVTTTNDDQAIALYEPRTLAPPPTENPVSRDAKGS